MHEFGFKQLTAKNLQRFNAQFETNFRLTNEWQEAFFATSMSSDDEASPKKIVQIGSGNLFEKMVRHELELIFLELADDKKFSDELLEKSDARSNARRKLDFGENLDDPEVEPEDNQEIRKNLLESPSSKIPHIRRISSSSDESDEAESTKPVRCESSSSDELGAAPATPTNKKMGHDLTNKSGFVLDAHSDESDTEDEPTDADRDFISDSETQIDDQSFYRNFNQNRKEKDWRSELDEIKSDLMR